MNFSRAPILLVTALVATGGAVVPAATAQAATVEAQLIATRQTGAASSWARQSPDPSGITYNPRTGHLIISDGEVEETPVYKGTNLFVSTLQGAQVNSGGTSVPWSYEPVGVGYRPSDGHLFVSDDDADRIFEVPSAGGDGIYGTGDDGAVTSFSTRFIPNKGNSDAEDVAVDVSMSNDGHVLVIDGTNKEVFDYGPGPNRKFDALQGSGGDDTVTQFDLGKHGALDPEGIAYHPVRDTILALDFGTKKIYELNRKGELLNVISIAKANPKKAAGIALAPASSGSGATHLYIVDRGVDNDSDPSENDGRFYEMSVAFPPLSGGTTTNQPPAVNAGGDFSVTLPATGTLNGSVTDSEPVTHIWTQVGGPVGGAQIKSPTSQVTEVGFTADGQYTFQLEGSDGVNAPVKDTVAVTVTPASSGSGGTPVIVEVPVRAGADDAEEKSTGTMVVTSGDLNMALDGSTRQTIGLRFTGLNIPATAKINKAYVQFQVDEVTTGNPSLTIAGQAAVSPPAFTSTSKNISSRTPTSASVAWTPQSWGSTVGARGEAQRTAELAPVIQQMVSSGWANNALVLLISGTTGTRTAESFEGGAAKAPVLHIEYTP